MKTKKYLLVVFAVTCLLQTACKTDDNMPMPNRCGDPAVQVYTSNTYDFLFDNNSAQLIAGEITGRISNSAGNALWFINNAVVGSPSGPKTIANCLVVENNMKSQMIFRGASSSPVDLLSPPNSNSWYSINAGQYYNGTIELIVSLWERTGSGTFDFIHRGIDVVVLDSASYTLINQATVCYSDIVFGSALLQTDNHVYIYGARNNGLDKESFVARVGSGSLLQTWKFCEEGNWLEDVNQAKPIQNSVNDYYTVFNHEGVYYMVSQTAAFGQEIALYSSTSPFGGWKFEKYLYCRNTADGLNSINTKVLGFTGESLLCAQQLIDKNLQSLSPRKPEFIELKNWK
ncbi:MAG: hypothetical protein ACO1PI_07275 [Bacteroidota bacterium]